MEDKDRCGFCDGGVVDSGGVYPWGETIFAKCGYCGGTGVDPAKVEAGDVHLPPLNESRPFYREAGAEWTAKVSADREWSPSEVRLIEARLQREDQLRASLLREKDKDEEIERLKGLLRECADFVDRDPKLSKQIKAVVTGE